MLKGTPYEQTRDRTDGMDAVLDAYVLLAGFGARHQKEVAAKGTVCARSLYKRALKQDDPVRHLLYTSDLHSLICSYRLSIILPNETNANFRPITLQRKQQQRRPLRLRQLNPPLY